MALDPVRNPYTPGAGQRPAVLSGRQGELEDFKARLARLERGRAAQCTLIVGLRGVGKTVLLNQFAAQATRRSWVVVEHELSSAGNFLHTLVRLAQDALIALSPPSAWGTAARRVASVLTGMQLTYSIAGLSISTSMADSAERSSGDPARDLSDLMSGLGQAAQEADRGVVLMFDELQFASVEPLGALVAALHRVAQRELPITIVAAGLPQTRGVLAQAASYSERMFETRTVGALSDEDAETALAEPAAAEGVHIDGGALSLALDFTEGYPFFLQVFGDRLWRFSSNDRMTEQDARDVGPAVRDWLDAGFFTFRTDRLPAAQRRYLRAMAEVGGIEQSSGDVASILGLPSSATVGQTRETLIRRGLIYSPRLGYAAFTVPQFDDYLRRHFELETHSPRRRG